MERADGVSKQWSQVEPSPHSMRSFFRHLCSNADSFPSTQTSVPPPNASRSQQIPSNLPEASSLPTSNPDDVFATKPPRHDCDIYCYTKSPATFYEPRLQRLHSNLFAQFFNNGIEWHFAEFAFFSTTNGNGVVFHFLRANDGEVRNQVESSLTNLGADLFVA